MRNHSIALGTLLCLVTAGCNSKPSANYDLVELVPVVGTVTLNGRPLPSAVVTFEEPEEGTFAYGLTDENGYYMLNLDSDAAGCTPGKKMVQVSTTRKILGLNTDEGGGEEPEGEEAGENVKPKAKELVPDRYNKKSKLTVEVNPDVTTYDFELTSK